MKEPGIVQIGVKENITRDQLQGALDRILTELGCPACGLVGFDLRIRPDINLAAKLGGLDGITTISQYRLR